MNGSTTARTIMIIVPIQKMGMDLTQSAGVIMLTMENGIKKDSRINNTKNPYLTHSTHPLKGVMPTGLGMLKPLVAVGVFLRKLSDHLSLFPVTMASGRAPSGQNQPQKALSNTMNVRKYGIMKRKKEPRLVGCPVSHTLSARRNSALPKNIAGTNIGSGNSAVPVGAVPSPCSS